MVYIDLKSMTANFYNIKIEKNKKVYYLIVNSGKVGNKGTTSIVYESDNYSFCKNEFWRRVNDKRQQKFKDLNEMIDKIDMLFNDEEKKYCCDICNKELEKSLYNKIDAYLRNESDVDADELHPLYKKIACFDCQIKLGVYKGKKINK